MMNINMTFAHGRPFLGLHQASAKNANAGISPTNQ